MVTTERLHREKLMSRILKGCRGDGLPAFALEMIGFNAKGEFVGDTDDALDL
jgi:hypothetical protein